jgi:hypothetical protein
VTDALYEFFPEHKPQPVKVGAGKQRKGRAAPMRAFSPEASERGLVAGRNVTIISRGDDDRQKKQGELNG